LKKFSLVLKELTNLFVFNGSWDAGVSGPVLATGCEGGSSELVPSSCPEFVPKETSPVRSSTFLKREVSLGMALTALVIVCAWAWGKPFVAAPVATAPAPVQAQSQAPSASFTGIIVRDGEQFFLREKNGPIYRLDDSKDAQTFTGRTVVLTGRLDAGAKLIHVERIAPATK
jgi:hypothetical protein